MNNNKVLVITGGSKGIGRAIIEKFYSNDFDIITCARNEGDLDRLKGDLQVETQGKIHTCVSDLSKREEIRNFLDFVRLVGKPVDVLINNTGRFIPGEILSEEEGALEEMIDTNVYSAYHVSRGIVPSMKEQGSGHVFNICSTASLMAYPNGGSYCISKFAMYGMSKVLREELKNSGVKVSTVFPGATLTASWEGAEIPEERFMKPEDIADAIHGAYQLSDRTVVEDIILRPQLGDL